jgi:hypothetical protein
MEMQLASERRALRRAITFECQVVREQGFELLGRRGTDLSPDGMLLSSPVPAVLGEEVIVTFKVPYTDRWIDTVATVARIVRGDRRNDAGRAIGLLFDPLSSEDNRLLRWALRRHPPTFPARPMRVDYVATAALIALM